MKLFRAFIVGFSLALGPVAHAADGGPSAARLFHLSTKNTPPALTAARGEYEKLKKAKPGDDRIDYAYGIALINQHRYKEAVALLERFLVQNPGELHALRAKVWAQLQDRRYAPAITDAVSLSQHFARDTQARPEPDLEATARFLGVVFGYLDLARRGVVNEELRLASKRRILDALGETYLPAFDAGRQTVVERLAELTGRQERKHQQATQEIAKRKEKIEAALADDQTTMAASRETIQESAAVLDDARRQLGVLRTQLASLEKDRIRLAAQITYVQTLMLEIQADVLDDSASSGSAEVPFGTAVRYANLSVTLTGLNKQAFKLDARIRTLQTEASRLNARGRRESQTVAANQAVARKAGRRAKALQSQVGRLEASRPKRRGPTADMKKLSTYLPFSFEEEKQRVLSWFKTE